MRQITLPVEDDLFNELSVRATKLGTTKKDLIIEAVENYLKQPLNDVVDDPDVMNALVFFESSPRMISKWTRSYDKFSHFLATKKRFFRSLFFKPDSIEIEFRGVKGKFELPDITIASKDDFVRALKEFSHLLSKTRELETEQEIESMLEDI